MFNTRQQKEIDERFNIEIALIDRKIEVYRQEKTLEVDKDIQNRREINWKAVDDARADRIDKITAIKAELAQLQAKKENLGEIIKANKGLLDQKDAEIKRLNDIITLLVKQPVTIVSQHK